METVRSCEISERVTTTRGRNPKSSPLIWSTTAVKICKLIVVSASAVWGWVRNSVVLLVLPTWTETAACRLCVFRWQHWTISGVLATFVKRIVVINWNSLIRHCVYRVQRIGFLWNVCVCVLASINSAVLPSVGKNGYGCEIDCIYARRS